MGTSWLTDEHEEAEASNAWHERPHSHHHTINLDMYLWILDVSLVLNYERLMKLLYPFGLTDGASEEGGAVPWHHMHFKPSNRNTVWSQENSDSPIRTDVLGNRALHRIDEVLGGRLGEVLVVLYCCNTGWQNVDWGQKHLLEMLFMAKCPSVSSHINFLG